MTTTKTVPLENITRLGLHEGDTLQVLAAMGSGFVVRITQAANVPEPHPGGAAAAWLKSARGSVKLADGESIEAARMAYYRDKYHLEP